MGETLESTQTDAGAPLAGRSVLVTRTREQAAALADRLEALGAEVLVMPVIDVVDPEDWGPTDEAIANLDVYTWLVLTSTNGVERFMGRIFDSGRDARALAGLRIAAVGRATAEELARRSIHPDFVPRDYHAEGLVAGLRERGIGPRDRVLLARAEEAREVLPAELRGMGATVDVVHVYRLVTGEGDASVMERLRGAGVDVVTFASGGTAARFEQVLRGAGLDPDAVLASTAVASVGPVTTKALHGMGYEVAVEAPESTMESFASAIAEWAAREQR